MTNHWWNLLILHIPFAIFVQIHCNSDANRFLKHYRWTKEFNNGRTRRQLGLGSPQQIDLNITVPFIFSARLYPHGINRGDKELPPDSASIPLVLRNDLSFLNKNYSTIYIMRDGAIGLRPGSERSNRAIPFPSGPPMIAAFWTPLTLAKTGRVFFRETDDISILNLVRSEVQIQYRYSDNFKPKSVVIVTWQNTAPPGAPDNFAEKDRNIFQIALIMSENGTFAHFVYSKLKWHNNAVAGFNEGVPGGTFLSLPGSGTPDSMLLANESDIGIPGEWLFKIDGSAIRLCGPGFKGLECITKCSISEWSYDCANRCYCEGRDVTCNPVNGLCSGTQCRDGWQNFPHCDNDVDECEERGPTNLCPVVQPDCINTPGAYLCMCLTGYDTDGDCKGSKDLPQIAQQQHAPNQVIQLSPEVNTRRITPELRSHPSVAVNSQSQGNNIQQSRPHNSRQQQPRSQEQQSFTPSQQFFPVNQGQISGPRGRGRGISVTPITPPSIYIRDSNRSPNTVQNEQDHLSPLAPEERVVSLSPQAPTVFLTPNAPIASNENVIADSAGPSDSIPQSYESSIAIEHENLNKGNGGKPPPRLIIPYYLNGPPSIKNRKPIPVFDTANAIQQVQAVPVAVALPEDQALYAEESNNDLGISENIGETSQFESSGVGGAFQVPLNQQKSNVFNVPLLTPPPIFLVESDSDAPSKPPNFVLPQTPLPVFLKPARPVTKGVFPATFPKDADLSPVRPTVVNQGNIQRPTSKCSLQCGDKAHCKLNINGFPNCECDHGWTGDGIFCVDINECFLDSPCANGAQCQNSLGSYSCLCQTGFKSEGSNCVDIDECSESVIQCPGGDTSACFNTHGSYECRCKPGFNGDPSSPLGCIDINECLIPEFYCGQNADCFNTNGGFKCTCAGGFFHDTEKNGCLDEDECLKNPCSRAAVCTNNPGSFNCKCLTGYDGDGFTCQETILFPFDRQRDQSLPPIRNAVIEIPLSKPIVVLGQQFRRIYISSNGIVTFDQPMRDYDSRPLSSIRMLGLAPLYMPVDLSKGGSVYYRETTDAPHFAADFSSLTRGSLSVQEDFQEPGFRAHSIVVVTYSDVRPVGSNDDRARNTFQIVLTVGETGTYLTYIYDVITNSQGQSGIISPNVSQVLVLPDSGLNAVRLAETSNLAQPGKWMFRIDRPLVVQCPAGRSNPPFCDAACKPGFWGQSCSRVCRCEGGLPCDYTNGICLSKKCQTGYSGANCQTDIDECQERTDQCHAQARCTNIEGSYKCTCIDGYTGDGFMCSELDTCTAVFGYPCHKDASCSLDSTGLPRCLCGQGYTGDGFSCQTYSTAGQSTDQSRLQPVVPVQSLPSPLQPPPFSPIPLRPQQPPPSQQQPPPSQQQPTPPQQLPSPPQRPPSRPIPPLPPVTIFTPRPPFIDNRIETESVRVKAPATTRRPLIIHGNKIDDDNEERSSRRNAVLSGSSGQRRNSTSSTSNMLVIIIPAILCGVWLILIVVLLVVCLRRRKRRQEKHGLGYYLPPTAGKDANTPANWAIPRPAYEYYQGTASYYPAATDPYGSYT